MALALATEYSVNIAGTLLTVTDKTGAYVVTTNEGGWGAPNSELDESALVCIVVRKASEGDELFDPDVPDARFIYDNAADNSKETSFVVKFPMDGSLEISLLRLPVSLDGTTYVPSGTIQESDYFVYNGAINQLVSGLATPIADGDVVDLLEDGNLIKKTCEDFITPKLALKRQELYKEYRVDRIEECDDGADKFKTVLELREDIQGAYYAFFSGLKVEAQNQIEDLIEQYDIVE